MSERSYYSEAKNQPEWRVILSDAEERIEVLRVAIEDLRTLVHNLSLMALAETVLTEAAAAPPVTQPPPEPAVPFEQTFDRPLGAETSPPPAPLVEATRPRSPWEGLRDDGFFSTGRHVEEQPAPLPPLEYDEEREEVRRAVEMARAELASGSPPGEDDEDPWQSPAPELDEDSQAARDEVRRAVEAARAELDASLRRENTDAWYDPSFRADTGDADASGPNTAVDERDEVRRAVAAARAELDAADFSLEDEIETEIDWPRESGTSWPQAPAPEQASEITPASEQAPAVTWQMPELQDLSLNPSVIMLEDVQGHVDLARVYEVLAHLDCTETASLLNYASHNVSIGLSSSNVMPSAEQITEAVKAVFGRGCKVTSDGIRLSVRIGDEHGRAA